MLFKFLTEHWKKILAVVLFSCYIIKTQYDYAVLYKTYIDSINSYDDQIAKMQDLHIRNTLKKNKLIESYRKEIVNINKKHADRLKALDSKVKVTKRKHVENFTKNPKKLIQDIEGTFGFEHVK
mgnify:CR=1 FL=1